MGESLIEYQTQRMQGTSDCFLAALASAVGRPYGELWPDWFQIETETARGTYNERVDKAFDFCGLKKDWGYWLVEIPDRTRLDFVRQMLRGRRALLQVRSLTQANVWHIIYWTGNSVFDPSPDEAPRYNDISQCCPVKLWIFSEFEIML